MGFKTQGKLIYDPTAGQAQNSWWMIVECPKDIIEYYQYWITKETGNKLNRPLFGAHISVIRGEEPPEVKKRLWKKYHEEEISLEYEHKSNTNGEYWWLEVTCERLKEIRKEIGLAEEVEFGFHLTIGKVI